jgi:hypothetical protein
MIGALTPQPMKVSPAASAMSPARSVKSSIRAGLLVIKTSSASFPAASRQVVLAWNERAGWLHSPITVVAPSGS